MKINRIGILAGILLIFTSVSLGQFDPDKAKIKFSDQAVQKAIEKGAEFILSRQMADGSWPAPASWGREPDPNDPSTLNCKIGATSLSLYALMEKGVSYNNEKIAKGLKWLEETKEKPEDRNSNYGVSFRCQAWFNAWKQAKATDKAAASKYRKLLETDVAKYVRDKDKSFTGGYSYPLINKGGFGVADNSNSQYGVLAVWAGYRAGMEIPRDYWEKVMKYWLPQQKGDGGWGYEAGEATYSMTAAGIATLFVCIDATMGDKFVKCNVQNEFAPVKKALEYNAEHFKAGFNEMYINQRQAGEMYYSLYGYERVGLASGYKYFGDIDWYKYGAALALNQQKEDGSWNRCFGPDIASGYAMLFLIRGQRAVLFNRLEYDGDWNNRPRALANFCRWAEGVYEQEVNWQIITLRSGVGEWHDAPVVTLTGSRAPKFSDEDIVKLRTYVNQGGTLFSMTECGGARVFGKGMKDAYAKIFPKYELTAAGRDHPIYTCQYKLPGMPAFLMVSNGIRALAIHTDGDLPLPWQTYQVATGRINFEAAANLLMYVTDKQLKNRGSNLWPEEPAKAPSRTLKAARIRYAGNYDPEPLALQRLSRLMAQQCNLKLDLGSPPAGAASEPAGSLPETGFLPSELTAEIKIAFMTGTGGFKLADKEKEALKQWVDSGGLLIMDAAGASKGFAESARDMIADLWGSDSLLPLPLDNPIYQLKDMTIDKVKYRRATRARIGGIREPRLTAVLAGNRPKVLFSAEDLSGGLIGYNALGMDGYESDSAYDVMRNICIYAVTAPALPKSATPAPSGSPTSTPASADSK